MKKRRLSAFVANWLRENPHFWYSLLLLPIFVCYVIPEQLIVTGYHPTQIAFDSLIPLLPGAAPCASMVSQFAQLYDKRPDWAGSINVLSTILCVITLPLMAALDALL